VRHLNLISTTLLLLAAAGCSDPVASDAANATEDRPVRIVEVLAEPSTPTGAFVELRNDGQSAKTLNGWSLVIGGTAKKLVAQKIPGSTATMAGRDPSEVEGHQLALIVDKGISADEIARVACEKPVVVEQSSLGTEHAAADDPLASTLKLVVARRCVPVFTLQGVTSLQEALRASTELRLEGLGKVQDSATASFGGGALGVGFERIGEDDRQFAPSPLGATPGARNFFATDPAERAPITVMHASPWRVGDLVTELRKKAAAGDSAAATELAAVTGGQKLPENPLVEPFDRLVDEAQHRIGGAFYQINDSVAVETLAAAAGERGSDVAIVTDAEFKGDEHYVEEHKHLTDAGVSITYDEVDGAGRAPLMHHKFLVVDDLHFWTGSFNVIEDEPHRIHADNVILFESPALAQLANGELEILRSGLFGILKRGSGVAGGNVHVDGARVDIRFSPGITDVQRKKRGAALAQTGDVRAACEVVNGSNKPIVEERYRNLDPCGGPIDQVISELGRATSSIYFVAFSLAHEDVTDLLIERKNAGVEVKGVVDPTVSTKGVAAALLADGADVRYTPNSNPECPEYITPKTKCPKNPNKVWLHHKFLVIDYGTDHPVVITGSHNISAGAELQNDEGMVVIHDRAVAEQYYRIFREVYDHPQALGQKRSYDGLPLLAITEVRPSADPAGQQFVELQNLADEAVSLEGLELWNREVGWVLEGEVAPGGRAVVSVGTLESNVPAGVELVEIPIDPARPFVGPGTGLVLRASDGRWIATYDPYTAQQNLPAGLDAPSSGQARQWNGFGRSGLDDLLVELLGVNDAPGAEVPVWSPPGFFSDWLDGYDASPLGLVLMRAAADVWHAAPGLEGTPGTD
jgi:phosphatidylserine/phosphatidylglycerophosphate/cardiolipin synthase-like enzyme